MNQCAKAPKTDGNDELRAFFAALQKGDTIGRESIEMLFGVSLARDEKRYRFAQRELVAMIERFRRDLYPRCVGDDVRVMPDAEAEAYNCKRTKSHVDGLVRESRRRTRIDRTGFSEAERKAAESRDLSYSALAFAARKALRKAEKEAELFGQVETR